MLFYKNYIALSNLVVSRGKLFCSACREEISLKSSSVKNHLRSAKHAEGEEKIVTVFVTGIHFLISFHLFRRESTSMYVKNSVDVMYQ